MTIKEFEEAKSTEPDFDKWFQNCAWYTVNISGVQFPCVKIGRKKAGLPDGTVIPIDDPDNIKRIDNRTEKEHLFTSSSFLHIYQRLNATDRLSVNNFLQALDAKTTVEREALEKTKTTAEKKTGDGSKKSEDSTGDDWKKRRCSFCGRSLDKVKKMVAGPNYVYICNECIDICSDIMKEELGNDHPNRN